jgi:hypothetical protein
VEVLSISRGKHANRRIRFSQCWQLVFFRSNRAMD